ncbi:hypothetical protein MASR2M74_15230 [Paracoccaceae bacterium]
MLDGQFDAAFHQAFNAHDDEGEPLAMPGWLAALTVAASVSLLGAIWAVATA